MKCCSKCGKEVVDDAVVCVHCGCSLGGQMPTTTNDAPSAGFAVVGFLIPLVGLSLYLVNKDTAPQKAASAGKGALTGVIVSVVLSILYAVLVAAMVGSYY